jgi:thiamine-monophosphate kinase
VETLRDLGERRIVRELLPEYVACIGNDCALVETGGMQIVATTDPVPEPAARVIGGDPDLYWMGWLLVVINASDVAASGAEPLAFLAAIEAPSDLETERFRRLLRGIQECCEVEGLKYVGGNLREAPRLSAVGTAIGVCEEGAAITRAGAEVGDVLVSVGRGGIFWRDAVTLRAGGSVSKDTSPVFRPRSQLSVMRRLRAARLVKAAIDNSDGLLPTLQQLGSANSLRAVLDLERLRLPHEVDSSVSAQDSSRLWLGWGDWNVVAAMRASDVSAAQRLAEEVGGSVVAIGGCVQGTPEVWLKRGGNLGPAPRLESERFAADSWFGTGTDSYLHQLMTIPLP